MSSASAPGKIILFGEHAVVYGRPALAIPVTQVGVTVAIQITSTNNEIPDIPSQSNQDWKERISIFAPAIHRSGVLASYDSSRKADPIGMVIENVVKELEINSPPSLHIDISSSIPVSSGFGSGAAVSVALVRALAATFGRTIPDEKVSQIAFEAEKLHHGTPSGIDNTVVTYARPVYFIKDKPIQTFAVGAPFTLVIADSGIRAATRESVGDVRRLWLANPQRFEDIFTEIAAIVETARRAIQQGDEEELGELMNQNHRFLQELTVSSPLLDHLKQAALNAGASGAKLSGGGRGGNLIALVSSETIDCVATALGRAGARQIIITTVI
jgi:mevalonate kinase